MLYTLIANGDFDVLIHSTTYPPPPPPNTKYQILLGRTEELKGRGRDLKNAVITATRPESAQGWGPGEGMWPFSLVRKF